MTVFPTKENSINLWKPQNLSIPLVMSRGEDMDACLEQANKDLKVLQPDKMVALDWL